MDLKNKLTEEEFYKLYEFCKCCGHRPNCAKMLCIDCKMEEAKQAGIIRKSAREELDAYIKIEGIWQCTNIMNNDLSCVVDFDYLKQLIDAAIKEEAERREGR